MVMLEAFGYDTYVNHPDQTTGMCVFVNNQSTLRVGQEGESCLVEYRRKADWKPTSKMRLVRMAR